VTGAQCLGDGGVTGGHTTVSTDPLDGRRALFLGEVQLT
jgi:hypothetical protein